MSFISHSTAHSATHFPVVSQTPTHKMGKFKLLGFLQLNHRSTIADRMGLGLRCSKTIVDHHNKSGVEIHLDGVEVRVCDGLTAAVTGTLISIVSWFRL